MLDTNEGISPRTVNMYMTAIRSYLAYYNIDVLPSRFKRRVKMPKLYREDEKAVDSTDIRKLLLNCNNRRLKTLLLILASGGMRVRSTSPASYQSDFHCISPTKIHLRKEYS